MKCHSKHQPKSHLDKSYESDIKTFLKGQYPSKTDEAETLSRIYILAQGGVLLATKVDVDDYIHPSMLKATATTSKTENLNPLALRHARGSALTKFERCIKMFGIACVDLPDNENAVKHWAKVQRCGYEQILYQINAYDNGMYEIAPGLTGDDHEPYVFRSPAGVWYEYWIENVTAKPPPQPIHSTVPKSLQAQVRLAYRPALGHVQLNVFGEILRAEAVDGDDLWVEYQIDLPDGWQWSKTEQHRLESSVTQISHSTTGPDRRCRVCNFAFPIEFELSGRLEDDLLSWPTIYFQVNSTDIWDCDRPEGYTSIQVPSSPGCHEIRAQLWRPSGTWADARARFFVGSCPALKDIVQGGLPDQSKDKGTFNRYGFGTIQNGALLVRLNVVLTLNTTATPGKDSKKLPLLLTSGIDEALRRQKALLDSIEALRVSSLAGLPEPKDDGPKMLGINRRLSFR